MGDMKCVLSYLFPCSCNHDTILCEVSSRTSCMKVSVSECSFVQIFADSNPTACCFCCVGLSRECGPIVRGQHENNFPPSLSEGKKNKVCVYGICGLMRR